ncbi:ribosome-associated ATPase/putative transporter RbbA [Bradyrhizobium sp.]|uniref:ribosome-associated ATPase/putative transporter RbbA n=1 Tax=Bradyrhizobium sp. TaxID=376 RepID=UPI003C7953FB
MSPTEELAVEVIQVTHRYAKVAALNDISLAIPGDTSTAFVGPDGVGKSTLLALIAGVRRLQSGAIRTLDGDVALRAHRDRISPRIAYMPQGLGRNLYPSLSVYENVDFIARLFGQSPAERRNRIERLLRATGLDPFPDRPAGKLSGGMKQKLSLCCSLIHDPDLLILDEPTTGIDPLSRRQFWTLIGELRQERPGMTVLVATAYMEEAERFDRLVVMDGGRVLAAAGTTDILARTGASTLEQAYIALRRDRDPTPVQGFVMSPRKTASGPPAIVAQGLSRKFGDFTAVDDVSFSIERGEIFGFLGSNGSGKTTTMKMLTGLLGITSGHAELLGKPVQASDLETRLRVGYMSQSFSLYEELTVRANLELHARLYRVPEAEIEIRVDEALRQFELVTVASQKPSGFPLGIRQRLQLAAACLHRPEVLILDEPTSGVDPAARDMFWRFLRDLSRQEGVTIFVSTHFMNEAERCDRISLMHAGKVLAVGTPAALRRMKSAANLEDAFIAYLESADAAASAGAPDRVQGEMPRQFEAAAPVRHDTFRSSWKRIWAFARREMLELMRDRVRIAFALAGPLVLMMTFGYGITFDVENLTFAVLDRDQSLDSRQMIESFAGSRYFREQAPLRSEKEIDRRLRDGGLRMAISIPPGFGRDLVTGHKPEVGFFLDGAMPFRAETMRGYVEGTMTRYMQNFARGTHVASSNFDLIQIEPRFRYNQDFRSAFAITPGLIMIFLVIFPSMLAALGIVREREIGSISNLYASPASIAEFILGKQAPYVLLGFVSFLSLMMLVDLLFNVTVKGSFPALIVGVLLYIYATTALGTLVSTFVRTQVAAIVATAIIATVPAINFSGYIFPVAGLEGSGRFIGMGFPSLWFQNISLGTFTKARDFAAFYPEFLILFGFGCFYLLAASFFLRKQES